MEVTKNGVLKFLKWCKQYEVKPTKNLKTKINNYIKNVINKDKRYYSKISSYNLNVDDLKYLL